MTYPLATKIIADIKSLRVQGAEAVALQGARALATVIKVGNKKDIHTYTKKLIQARTTEPALRNSLHYLLNCLQAGEDHRSMNCYRKIKNHFTISRNHIAEILAEKITNNSKIYTHCHSSTVTHALIYAHRHGKKFTVLNTETRPRYQGRKTAKQLIRAGITVDHYVDSAMRLAIHLSDLVLLGADSISSEGNLINKIGSEIVAIIANKYEIPLYCLSNSWKFDISSLGGHEEKIEQRDPKEVWSYHAKHLTIHNPAFEKVPASYITSYITELGVLSPAGLQSAVSKHYPFLGK